MICWEKKIFGGFEPGWFVLTTKNLAHIREDSSKTLKKSKEKWYKSFGKFVMREGIVGFSIENEKLETPIYNINDFLEDIQNKGNLVIPIKEIFDISSQAKEPSKFARHFSGKPQSFLKIHFRDKKGKKRQDIFYKFDKTASLPGTQKSYMQIYFDWPKIAKEIESKIS